MVGLMEEVTHIIGLHALKVFIHYIQYILLSNGWVTNSSYELLLVILKPSVIGGNNDHSCSFREQGNALLDEVDRRDHIGSQDSAGRLL